MFPAIRLAPIDSKIAIIVMIIVFTFCWSVKGGQGPSGPAIPCRSLGRRPGVDSGLGLWCLVSVGGEVSGVAYVVDEVGGRDVRPGVVCGVVEGLGVHLRFPFRLVTTALCRGARRGVNGTRGAPQGSRGPLTSRRAPWHGAPRNRSGGKTKMDAGTRATSSSRLGWMDAVSIPVRGWRCR